MIERNRFFLLAATILLGTDAEAARQSCTSQRHVAVAQHFRCLLKADAQSIRRERAADYTRCASSFDRAWSKGEKFGTCLEGVEQATLAEDVAAMTTQIRDVLVPASQGTPNSRQQKACAAKKLGAAGKLLVCTLKHVADTIDDGVPAPDYFYRASAEHSGRVLACEDRTRSALGAAERKGGAACPELDDEHQHIVENLLADDVNQLSYAVRGGAVRPIAAGLATSATALICNTNADCECEAPHLCDEDTDEEILDAYLPHSGASVSVSATAEAIVGSSFSMSSETVAIWPTPQAMTSSLIRTGVCAEETAGAATKCSDANDSDIHSYLFSIPHVLQHYETLDRVEIHTDLQVTLELTEDGQNAPCEFDTPGTTDTVAMYSSVTDEFALLAENEVSVRITPQSIAEPVADPSNPGVVTYTDSVESDFQALLPTGSDGLAGRFLLEFRIDGLCRDATCTKRTLPCPAPLGGDCCYSESDLRADVQSSVRIFAGHLPPPYLPIPDL